MRSRLWTLLPHRAIWHGGGSEGDFTLAESPGTSLPGVEPAAAVTFGRKCAHKVDYRAISLMVPWFLDGLTGHDQLSQPTPGHLYVASPGSV